jgi:hypothetical protein
MRGGDDSEGNLVACCLDCNRLKGGASAWSFLACRPDMRANFVKAAAHGDTQPASPIWKRLLRAIEEAAADPAKRAGRPLP